MVPDPSAGTSAVPNKDKSVLGPLRDSKGDDGALASAGRRLRELRSKSGDRSALAQPAPAPRDAPVPRKRERTFEVLDQPLPSERAPESDTMETPRVPGVSAPPPPTAAPRQRTRGAPLRPTEERPTKSKRTRSRAQRTRPARGVVRRVKRTVKRVDPWSVLKMSLFYYTIFFVVWMIGVAVLFSFIESTGLLQNIESLGDGLELEQLSTFEISMGVVLRWAAYIGAGLVLLASIVNVILAFLYNLGSDIVGGITVTFAERDE